MVTTFPGTLHCRVALWHLPRVLLTTVNRQQQQGLVDAALPTHRGQQAAAADHSKQQEDHGVALGCQVGLMADLSAPIPEPIPSRHTPTRLVIKKAVCFYEIANTTHIGRSKKKLWSIKLIIIYSHYQLMFTRPLSHVGTWKARVDRHYDSHVTLVT